MKDLSIIKRILIWLAGYDRETAEDCTSSEVFKMSVAGTLVLIPGLLGLFSYGYAFHLIFGSMQAAIAGGMISAFVLILIDRAIMSWSRQKTLSVGLTTRLFLALTGGFLLAEPIVLKVFEGSIREQQYSEVQRVVKAETAEIQLRKDAVITDLRTEETALKELQIAYTQEMDGTGGSGIRSTGPIYKQKKADFLKAERAHLANKAESNEKLDALDDELKTRTLQLTNLKDAGLLGSLRSLHNIGKKEPIVNYSTWLLRLLFIQIELLPFFLKMSKTGDLGVYYKLVDLNDKERWDMLQLRNAEKQALNEGVVKLESLHKKLAQNYDELEMVTNANRLDIELLMDKSLKMAEYKMDTASTIEADVQDEPLKVKITEKLNKLVKDFYARIDQLIDQTNRSFNTAKDE